MFSASERVEFFQSESEFGSETSLNNSRYFDFTNEIISETDNLFLTLRRELLPNDNFLQHDKVKYSLSRAQILYKDTIPEHLAYLSKIEAPGNARGQVTACSDKLERLLKDYDSLKTNTMISKQFFNLYGKDHGQQENGFQKGERVFRIETSEEDVLQPETIQINYSSRAKLKATPRVFMAASPAGNDKELTNLREEVHLLKKRIEDMKRQHDLELTNEKLLAEKRIRTYLHSNGDKTSTELEQYSFKLSCSEEENRNLKESTAESERMLEILRLDNASLQSQIEILRKRDINMEEDENAHDRSYNTDLNEKEDRRTEKKLKISQHENEILKKQLKTERQKLYRLTSDLSDEERRELERVKKQLQRKNDEFETLQGDFDKQRIEIVQLSHNYKSVSKLNDGVKDDNEELRRINKLMSKETVNAVALPSATELEPSLTMSRRLQVGYYEGEGIEGLPYYESLNKEFRVRFRRACLKEKELLHKSNGLEVGVITTFEKPNRINLLLHMANYGDIDFRRMKGKLLNANENKIEGETFQFAAVLQNDQVKIPVSLLINHYPLGPLILLLEYDSDKREELRILLPSHIFKMMEFDELTEPLKNAGGISIITERKVLKNLEDFRQYVRVAKVENGVIKLSAYHRHTHTELRMNLVQTKDGVDLIYQHYQGNSNITEYFVKTLAFLLRK